MDKTSRFEPTVICALTLVLASACASDIRRFPVAEPLQVDPDKTPFSPPPSEYFSGFVWDAADQTIFRPLSDTMGVKYGGEARNVNSVDEVANSSWFTNRLGSGKALTPAEAAKGACNGVKPLEIGAWTVSGAKPNGANPGFQIKAQDGRSYLLKFDGVEQGARATGSDTIVSRMYWAAGFETPCNQIVFFDRGDLTISPKAKGRDSAGNKEPLADRHLDKVFAKAIKLSDGRYRASASLFVNGRPIGPWRYEDTRDDDPNDVIDHEDRRELRGAAAMASWVNHFDSREQNSLATFVKTGPDQGWIQHYLIDFGDCFGSLWAYDAVSRRLGKSYLLDLGDIALDFITLGALVRPWDKAKYGASGDVWAYFGIDDFEPDTWKNEYPNPSFSNMTTRDAAWMSRIIARFTDAHLKAFIDVGYLKNPALEAELLRILKGRRDKILRHWFSELSPLAHPRVKGNDLCVEDLAVTSGLASVGRQWTAAHRTGADLGTTAPSDVRVDGAIVCVTVPDSGDYRVVDIAAKTPSDSLAPARIHLAKHLSNWRVVGLDRPE